MTPLQPMLLVTVALLGPLSDASAQRTPPLRRGDLPLAEAYRPFRAPFSVRLSWEGQRVDVTRQVIAVPLLPGSRISVSSPAGLALTVANGDTDGWIATGHGWEWNAPEAPGIYGARIDGPGGWLHVNLLVMHPAGVAGAASIQGYEIGAYQPRPRGRGSEYEPPPGFVMVPLDDWDVLVSPHVTLGELLCKQPGDPRAVYFTPQLLRKLEAVLEEVNRRGIDVPRLTVMSAFRTPAYHRAIGNSTRLSRHLWGDAADIFIDADGDGAMDDLNGDGRRDVQDARYLAALIDEMMDDPPPGVHQGGLSPYRPTTAHGGFVHVDARGRRARW